MADKYAKIGEYTPVEAMVINAARFLKNFGVTFLLWYKDYWPTSADNASPYMLFPGPPTGICIGKILLVFPSRKTFTGHLKTSNITPG
jgi:hypothetical protein